MTYYKFIIYILFIPTLAHSQEFLQLAPPIPSEQRSFINHHTTLSFDFRMENANIRYTENGSIPNSKSKLYTKPSQIKKASTIRAKVFHPYFAASDDITIQYYKTPKINISLEGTLPHPQYAGNGLSMLSDKTLGDVNFKQNFLGYNEDVIELSILPTGNKKAKAIHISFLINQGAWIFGPSQIDVLQNNQLVSTFSYLQYSQSMKNQHVVVMLPIKLRNKGPIQLRIKSIDKLPEWHGGAGNRGWVFMDEVWVE
jgi:hypothetical protein